MQRNLLAVILLLTLPFTGMAADEIVKDNFEDQAEGHLLSELINWKFHAGWIKPEDGKVTVDNGNKFLRLHGDVFARNLASLADQLTCHFKIRAGGDDEEIGGLDLRGLSGKTRYDILFSYKRGGVVLVRDVDGGREELGKATAAKPNVFQDVVVVLERVAEGVRFTVTVDGEKLIDTVDTQELPFLKEHFHTGFFTYHQKTIDIDDVEITTGK